MASWDVKAVSLAIALLLNGDGYAQEYSQQLSHPHSIIQQPQQTSSSLMTLQDRAMLDELELIDSQRQELVLIWHEIERTRNEKRTAIFNQFTKLVADNHPNMGSKPIPLDTSSPVIQSALKDMEMECDKLYMTAIEEVFLPHQLKRFRELQARTEFNTVLNTNARLSLLVESLNVTEDQLDKIKSTAPEFNKKLELEIARLREKRHREYWESVLTKNQMENLETILGNPVKPLEHETKSSDNQAVNGSRR
jgi:hypothetical protein